MTRKHTFSGVPWEERYGYSRALRVRDLVFVSGTSATDSDGIPQAVGDPGAQTLYILQKIDNALRNVGSSLNDVVRARYWVTDLAQADAIGRSHAKLLGKVRPAMTMAEVSGLMLPEHLVEIEVDAVITEPIKNAP